MLKYRLTRRLLEHTHNPWFWSGSDTDSDSGGRSPPIPPSKNQVRDQEDTGGRAEAELEECGGARTDTQQEQSRLPIQEEEDDTGPAAQSALHGNLYKTLNNILGCIILNIMY